MKLNPVAVIDKALFEKFLYAVEDINAGKYETYSFEDTEAKLERVREYLIDEGLGVDDTEAQFTRLYMASLRGAMFVEPIAAPLPITWNGLYIQAHPCGHILYETTDPFPMCIAGSCRLGGEV